jgi:hypothetical protein
MTGKEKVARRVVERVTGIMLETFGKYVSPNWTLDDIDGIKGATAERRLRELREEFCGTTPFPFTNPHYGYRPSREHENYWEYEKEFIGFLKNYVEQREKK